MVTARLARGSAHKLCLNPAIATMISRTGAIENSV
jgi:hypothetical protein